MNKRTPPKDHCNLARSIELLGDRWRLMIIRSAMQGTHRFIDFQRELGVARNILTDRLNRLVDEHILRRVDVGAQGQRYEYRLTDRGRDLFVVMTALRQWGDRQWGHPLREDRESAEPAVASHLIDRFTQQPVPDVSVINSDGRRLKLQDVRLTKRADDD